MPGLYAKGDFDLAGFSVGAVERGAILPKTADMRAGDVLIGVASSRRAFQRLFAGAQAWWSKAAWPRTPTRPSRPAQKLGEALLTPTRLYVKSALAAIRAGGVKGLAHITGGGITENLPRALPDGLDAEVDLDCWTPPPVFGWLAKPAGIAAAEMLRTFNCGIGMVAVVAEKCAGHVIDAFQECGDKAMRLGTLVPGEGEAKVRLSRDAEAVKKVARAILISGRGSNLRSLIARAADPAFPAEIVLVISNVEGAGGLQRAAEAGIATKVISHKAFTSREAFDAEIDAALRAHGGRDRLPGRLHAHPVRLASRATGKGGCSTSILRCCPPSRACTCMSGCSQAGVRDVGLHGAFRGAGTGRGPGHRPGDRAGGARRHARQRSPRASWRKSTSSIPRR